MIGWVGDPRSALTVHLYTDADFAGDQKALVSTTGVHLVVRGPKTCFPLSGISKKQTSVSHSTPEAEIVAADHGLRVSGVPAVPLWDTLLGKRNTLQFHE